MAERKVGDVSPETTANVRRLSLEIGRLFHQSRLDPDVASAVMLDAAARITAHWAKTEEVAQKLAVAGGQCLVDLTMSYYADKVNGVPRANA